MGCPCCGCACGEKKVDGTCVSCIPGVWCENGNIVAEWNGITLPDDGCPSWAINEGGVVYILALGNLPGYYSHVPSGFIVVDGVCKLVGSVGTVHIPDTQPNTGDCRTTSIAWKWSVNFPSCAAMVPGTHTALVEFYSGYNQFWNPADPEIVTITSAAGACAAISPPTITIILAP